MSFYDLLIHKCDIYRYINVINKDKSHFTKQELKLIYKNVNCRFIRKQANNILTNGHTNITVYYKLVLPKSKKIQNGDIVIWDLDKQANYKVQEPYFPSNIFNSVILKKEDET